MKFLRNLTLLSGFLFLSVLANAQIAVIVHPSNTDNVDGITKIFLGKVKKFESGSEVVPLYLKDGDTRSDFNSKVLEKSDSQIKAYWSKLMFTGKGSPPIELNSDAEVIDRVSNDPNAIGYIDAANITDNVKVIATY